MCILVFKQRGAGKLLARRAVWGCPPKPPQNEWQRVSCRSAQMRFVFAPICIFTFVGKRRRRRRLWWQSKNLGARAFCIMHTRCMAPPESGARAWTFYVLFIFLPRQFDVAAADGKIAAFCCWIIQTHIHTKLQRKLLRWFMVLSFINLLFVSASIYIRFFKNIFKNTLNHSRDF